ncbi:MAG: hypothetical protein WA210_15390 [Burkholderiaceae bacterium]
MLAVGLHAAMFSVPVRNDAGLANPPTRAGTRATTVRMLSMNTDRAAFPGGAVTTRAPARELRLADSKPEPAAASETHGDRHVASKLAASASVSPRVHGLALRLPGALGDDDFFARSALDAGPYPTQPVLIDYPSVEIGSGRHVGELALFVDENGTVVRIRAEGSALPATMEEAARSAFMGATFVPGQVDGLPVRSRIRVEVVFEENSAVR